MHTNPVIQTYSLLLTLNTGIDTNHIDINSIDTDFQIDSTYVLCWSTRKSYLLHWNSNAFNHIKTDQTRAFGPVNK